jgi:hypothetical protein
MFLFVFSFLRLITLPATGTDNPKGLQQEPEFTPFPACE